MSDFIFSLRVLRKAPGFALLVVTILAIGIGANTAVFSLLYQILLRPLPYPNSDRIVALYETKAPNDLGSESALAPGNFLDWRDQNRSLSAIGGFAGFHYILESGGPPAHVWGGAVSAGWWDVFGIRPELGRTFTAEDDRPGAAPVVVLTDRLWRERFHADPQIVGESIVLNDQAYLVLGVMPADPFTLHPEIDFWAPLERQIPPDRMRWRDARFLGTFARLKSGVTLAQASEDLNRITAVIRRENTAGDVFGGAAVRKYRDAFVGEDVRREVFIAFAVVGLVLLVACANVANLMLVRITNRERELAVRIALGARPVHVLRQLVIESVSLAFAGSLLALALAAALVKLGSHWQAVPVPQLNSASVNLEVALFSFAVAALAGVAFVLIPALAVLNTNTQDVLRRSAQSVTGRRGVVRRGLAIAEIACSVVLLTGTGLLLRSMVALENVPLGFEADHRTAAFITLPRMKYLQDRDVVRFFDEVVERVRALPGVMGAAVVNFPPMDRRAWQTTFTIPGGDTAQYHNVNLRLADGEYFSVLRIGTVGRTFGDEDTLQSEPVCIINKAMARQYWRGQEAIGKLLVLSRQDAAGMQRPRRIVGIAADVRDSINLGPQPTVYVPYRQMPFPSMNIIIQSNEASGALTPLVQRAVQQVDAKQPVSVWPLNTVVEDNFHPWKLALRLLGALAAVTLLLSAVGVFGVMSALAREKTKEFGIRIALGAAPQEIRNSVLMRATSQAVAGVTIGSIFSLISARALGSLIYGVRPADPTTLALVAAVMAATSICASYLPARRAMRVDPVECLRSE